ncbi:MAG: O-methyltransferase [Methanosaeta sp. PtaU1.Bin112]|nr:MAG: O-methyltransferase [Methanosaeta sp. PtaU1.Bin112]
MNLPEIVVSCEVLYRMLYAPIKAKLLMSGIELKVFNQLSGPKSAEEVAKNIGCHIRNTMVFLNGLAACDLLEKHNGLYQNTPIAQAFLVEGSPTYLGEGFVHQASITDAMLANLTKMIREGPPAKPSEDDADPQKWSQFASWMANNERAGIAQQMSELISLQPEFASFRKMLDLGGGPGIFGISMVANHPTMRGVIFDRKPVVEVAERFIKEYGLEDRMEVLAGDYNHDPIGEGYDLIWASATLNFARENMDAVMKKIYEALNPGGLFVNLSEGLTDEGTKPDFYVLCTVGWAMNGPMMAFDQGFIAESMLKAGFRSVRSRTLETGWGPMDIDIARK